MEFSIQEIAKLATLSRLALSEEELFERKKDLERAVGYIDTLQTIDVTGVEPMTHAVPMELVRREDEAKPVLGRKALEDSRGYEDGLNKVPAIIE